MPRGRPRKKTDNMLLKSAEMIGWALGGLEREIMATRERLSALTSQANALRGRLGQSTARATAAGSTAIPAAAKKARRKRRAMSAEARKRISEMMRKRWAERKKKGQNKL